MLIEYLYLPVILILYLRTIKYCNLVDDFVGRRGYLINLSERPSHWSFYDKIKPRLQAIMNIAMFIAACVVVHQIFGWKAALLYSVFPLNVSGVAWTTGSVLYMTAAFLVFTSYFLFSGGLPIFTAISPAIYFASLHSGVSGIPFAFLLPIISDSPYRFIMFIPLLFFLFGKKFIKGLKMRKEKHLQRGVQAGKLRIERIFVMTKVIAYYIALSLFPMRLGLFHGYMKQEELKMEALKPTRLFWLSSALIALFLAWGISVDWKAVLWFFLFIGIFSQFTTFGQFVAERYTHIANAGFCALMAAFIGNPVIFAVYAALLFCRSWEYTPAYIHNRDLFMYGANSFPHAQENYVNLSSHYMERGNFSQALLVLLKALRKGGMFNHKVNINASLCYEKMENYSQSVIHAKAALGNCPEKEIKPLNNRIMFLENKIIDKARKKSLSRVN